MKRLLPSVRTPLLAGIAALIVFGAPAAALVPPPGPAGGSLGLEATIPSAPPAQAATIATPRDGTTVTDIPITVSGLCSTGLLVKVFANNVFVGSVMCAGGSYQLKADLFNGQNDLVARVYDALDQAGPDSNVARVTFNDAQFQNFGTRVEITSNYARRGANPGDELDWPVTLSGGTPPYAVSVDWGDGKGADLMSAQFADTLTLKHTYAEAGTYNVVVKATDAKGTSAFLQLVGVANGAVSANAGSANTGQTITRTVVVWWPAVACIPLIAVTFWLGRRHELYTLRKQLEQQ